MTGARRTAADLGGSLVAGGLIVLAGLALLVVLLPVVVAGLFFVVARGVLSRLGAGGKGPAGARPTGPDDHGRRNVRVRRHPPDTGDPV